MFNSTPSSTSRAGLAAAALLTFAWAMFEWLYLTPRGLVAPPAVVSGLNGVVTFFAAWAVPETVYSMTKKDPPA